MLNTVFLEEEKLTADFLIVIVSSIFGSGGIPEYRGLMENILSETPFINAATYYPRMTGTNNRGKGTGHQNIVVRIQRWVLKHARLPLNDNGD